MKIPLIIFGIVIIAACLAAGIYFRKGNGLRWVNFLDYEEGKYDELRVLRFVGSAIILFGSILGVFAIAAGMFGLMWIFTVGSILFILSVIAVLIYMNTGGRFLK